MSPDAPPEAIAEIERGEQQRLRLFLYLVPVVGFFPALLSLYRKVDNRREKQISRLAVTLSLTWVLSLFLLGTGSTLAETPPLGAMVLSSMLTSGYFLANVWLMVQLWRRKRLWLPGLSDLGERLP